MKKVCVNAYSQYIRSRPGASVESIKRVKDINVSGFAIHPVFSAQDTIQSSASDILEKIKNYRPSGVRLNKCLQVEVLSYIIVCNFFILYSCMNSITLVFLLCSVP
jgi:ATP-dependent RNA helicase DDX54/DBP10